MVFPAAASARVARSESRDLASCLWMTLIERERLLGLAFFGFSFWELFAGNGQQRLKCCDPVSDSLQTAGRAVRRPHCVWLWASVRSEGGSGSWFLCRDESDLSAGTSALFLSSRTAGGARASGQWQSRWLRSWDEAHYNSYWFSLIHLMRAEMVNGARPLQVTPYYTRFVPEQRIITALIPTIDKNDFLKCFFMCVCVNCSFRAVTRTLIRVWKRDLRRCIFHTAHSGPNFMSNPGTS